MFTRQSVVAAQSAVRALQTSAQVCACELALKSHKQSQYQVTVLGAAGGIGQPLSLLLKLRSRVTKLHLYDINHTKGLFRARHASLTFQVLLLI
jgi:hypothetical protein